MIIDLTVLEEPTANVELNGVFLTANLIDGASYQWYHCDTNEPLDGENSDQLLPPASGEYYVEVALNGCSTISQCILFDWALSANPVVDKDIQIYPTRTDGLVSIDFSRSIEDVSIEVFSLDGGLVYSENHPSYKTGKLNIRNEEGMYLVQVRAKGRVLKRTRIIKK